MSFGSLIAELGLNNAPFRRGLDASKVYANKFASDAGAELKSKFTGAFAGGFTGAVVVGAIDRTFRGIFNKALEIKQISKEFEITTDQVQNLQKAASKEGFESSDLLGFLDKINTARKSAVEGNTQLRDAFSEFGFKLEDVNSSLLDEFTIATKIGDAFKNNATPAMRAYLKEIGGRGAGKLIPALMRLSDNAKPGIDKETVESVYAAKRAFEELERAILKIGSGPVKTVLGGLSEVMGNDRLWKQFRYMMVGGKVDWDSNWFKNEQVNRAMTPGSSTFIGPMPPRGFGEGQLFKDLDLQKQKAEVLKAQEDLKDAMWKIDFNSLSALEKESSLEQKITDLKKEAHDLREKGDESGSLKKQKEIIETAGQLEELQRKEDQAIPEGKPFNSFPNDAQVSYGNFLGSDPSGDVVDSIKSLQATLNQHLERIDQNTERTALGVSNNGGFPTNP